MSTGATKHSSPSTARDGQAGLGADPRCFTPSPAHDLRIAFTTDRDGNEEIYSMSEGGRHAEKQDAEPSVRSGSERETRRGPRLLEQPERGLRHMEQWLQESGWPPMRGWPWRRRPPGEVIWHSKRIVGGQADIFVTYSYDGDRQQVNLTNSPTNDRRPDWASEQSGTESYPRPKGASPMRASLIPFLLAPCSSPDRVHGPPLSYPSCGGFVQTSPEPHGRHPRRKRCGGQRDRLHPLNHRPWSVFPGPRTGLI